MGSAVGAETAMVVMVSEPGMQLHLCLGEGGQMPWEVGRGAQAVVVARRTISSSHLSGDNECQQHLTVMLCLGSEFPIRRGSNDSQGRRQ